MELPKTTKASVEEAFVGFNMCLIFAVFEFLVLDVFI